MSSGPRWTQLQAGGPSVPQTLSFAPAMHIFIKKCAKLASKGREQTDKLYQTKQVLLKDLRNHRNHLLLFAKPLKYVTINESATKWALYLGCFIWLFWAIYFSKNVTWGVASSTCCRENRRIVTKCDTEMLKVKPVVVFVAGFDMWRTQRWGQNCYLPSSDHAGKVAISC